MKKYKIVNMIGVLAIIVIFSLIPINILFKFNTHKLKSYCFWSHHIGLNKITLYNPIRRCQTLKSTVFNL